MHHRCQLVKISAGFGWLMLLQLPVAWATSYYFSNAGNDNNSGISASDPWYSTGQLNNVLLQPGDSVLFLSGNIFRGQINISAGGNETTPVYIGTYGGSLPAVISGAETVTAWTAYATSIFQAVQVNLPAQLFASQKRMVIARFPNSGYLYQQAGLDHNGFIDTALTQAGHYWDSAGIHLRTTDRLYEYNTVSSFSGDSILFKAPSVESVEKGYGYYLDNRFTELDTAGEWFYDTDNNILYCYSAGGIDPNTLSMEASVHEYGIRFENDAGYCIVENLQFEKQSRSAIFSNHMITNLTVKHCIMLSQGERGIALMNGAVNCLISDNTLRDISGAAIGASQVTNTLINRNAITAIGLLTGYGINTLQQGMGISVDDGNAVIIAENSIDSTGNSSINVNGLHTIIENNNCNHALLHFNNQGCIYSYGSNSDSVVIRHNIIENTGGSTEASPAVLISTAGIFLDEQTHHYLLENNTIAMADCYGIALYRGGTHHTLRKNTVFGSGKAQLYFEEINAGTNNSHTVYGNIFYALQEDADVVALKAYDESFTPAVFDSNYYFNPYDYYAVRKLPVSAMEPYGRFYTLEQWRQFYGDDDASKTTYFYRDRHIVADYLGDNLVGNGTFTNNTDGWSNSTPQNLLLLLDNSTPLDNGCMKLLSTSDQDISYGEAHCDGIASEPGAYYCFDLSCYALHDGNIGFIQKQSVSPYLPLDLIRFFPFLSGRRDYQCTFQYLSGDGSTSLYTHLPFQDSLTWLDNISIRKVSVVTEDPVKKSRLFVNHTASPQSFNLADSVFYDLDQQMFTGTITVPAFTSTILIFDSALITHDDGTVQALSSLPTLQIYPSITPAGSTVHIFNDVHAGESAVLLLTDLHGRSIMQTPVSRSTSPVFFKLPDELSPGMYFITLQQPYSRLTGRIVVY